MAAEPCQRRAAGLTQIDPIRTMRHLIRLNSTALLDSLQRNEIRSSRVIDVVGRGPRRIPVLFSGHGNRSLTVYLVVLFSEGLLLNLRCLFSGVLLIICAADESK